MFISHVYSYWKERARERKLSSNTCSLYSFDIIDKYVNIESLFITTKDLNWKELKVDNHHCLFDIIYKMKETEEEKNAIRLLKVNICRIRTKVIWESRALKKKKKKIFLFYSNFFVPLNEVEWMTWLEVFVGFHCTWQNFESN
jgi:hypothetical protein